ncbi:5105_t:CDS:2 [Paraglomus brasilianum]|uniref:5105_t:CDS:1 n=1 Tax=Paraglomus brasilianum TaxID=144538 RepID=A0A9N8YZ06_9GLOM|nr:5105_t:CDS:2 [Paraglomus brasilianum]
MASTSLEFDEEYSFLDPSFEISSLTIKKIQSILTRLESGRVKQLKRKIQLCDEFDRLKGSPKWKSLVEERDRKIQEAQSELKRTSRDSSVKKKKKKRGRSNRDSMGDGTGDEIENQETYSPTPKGRLVPIPPPKDLLFEAMHKLNDEDVNTKTNMARYFPTGSVKNNDTTNEDGASIKTSPAVGVSSSSSPPTFSHVNQRYPVVRNVGDPDLTSELEFRDVDYTFGNQDAIIKEEANTKQIGKKGVGKKLILFILVIATLGTLAWGFALNEWIVDALDELAFSYEDMTSWMTRLLKRE